VLSQKSNWRESVLHGSHVGRRQREPFLTPNFKKAENQERGVSTYHGVGGPLNVMDRSYTNPLSSAFIEAGVELGWPHNDDFNGASQEGFGTYQVTQRQGKRHSTAMAYLHPAQHRPNLTVLTQSLVTRVLFEGTRAVGVAYLKDRQEQQIRVNKEVILSGGTINSPQVLMLSNEADSRLLVEGVKLARRVGQAQAFAPFYDGEVLPGPRVQSEEEIGAFLRRELETVYHPVGTCKMGQDDQAVVDERLRVHGVEGLRVIDASIMPTIVNGHTMAPTLMIAEKGADLIREQVMKMQLITRAIGAPLNRIDGAQKVTGAARYAYEYPVESVTYVFPVQSTIAKGRIVSIDASAARALPGVIAVLSHENAPRLAPLDDAELAVFQADAVAYHGQFVAAVVAETSEIARQAASLVVVRYEEQPHDVELRADRSDLYKPQSIASGYYQTDTFDGDVEVALASAAVSLDQVYTTPP